MDQVNRVSQIEGDSDTEDYERQPQMESHRIRWRKVVEPALWLFRCLNPSPRSLLTTEDLDPDTSQRCLINPQEDPMETRNIQVDPGWRYVSTVTSSSTRTSASTEMAASKLLAWLGSKLVSVPAVYLLMSVCMYYGGGDTGREGGSFRGGAPDQRAGTSEGGGGGGGSGATGEAVHAGRNAGNAVRNRPIRRSADRRPYERGRSVQQQTPTQTPVPMFHYVSWLVMKTFINKLGDLKPCAAHIQLDRQEGVIANQAAHLLYLNPSLPSYKEDEQYEVMKQLGAGQYGSVDLVVDKKTCTEIARKKILLQDFVGREFEVLIDMGKASIYIPMLYALTLKGAHVFAFMEYAQLTWFDYLKRETQGNRYVDLVVLRDLLFDALQGLCFLHGEGIQHRDIKPQNLAIRIMEDGSCMCMLIDLGAALTSYESEQITLQGTAFYLGPKAAIPARCLKDDIWSLGCSVLCMLLRAHPWHQHVLPRQDRPPGLQPDLEKDNPEATDIIPIIADVNKCQQGIQHYVKMAFELSSTLHPVSNLPVELTKVLCNMLVADDTGRCDADTAVTYDLFKGLENRNEALESQVQPTPVPQAQPIQEQTPGQGMPSMVGSYAQSSLGSSPASPMQISDHDTTPNVTEQVMSFIRGSPKVWPAPSETGYTSMAPPQNDTDSF